MASEPYPNPNPERNVRGLAGGSTAPKGHPLSSYLVLPLSPFAGIISLYHIVVCNIIQCNTIQYDTI